MVPYFPRTAPNIRKNIITPYYLRTEKKHLFSKLFFIINVILIFTPNKLHINFIGDINFIIEFCPHIHR